MKFAYHTDWPKRLRNSTYIPSLFEKKGFTLVPPEEADIVLNVDSIHNTGLKKGKKLTIYWEVDDFMMLGQNKELYDQVDLLYIVSPFYKPFYPPYAKVCKMGIDPEFHKEDLTVEKEFDYVMVGSLEAIPSYEQRQIAIGNIMKTGVNIFVTYGTPENYARNLSRGKIIIDILPRVNGYACPHVKVLECMAIGCLMVNPDPILDDLGVMDIHYLSLDKFQNTTEEEVLRVKKASREHVLQNHTWEHRVDQMIKDIKEKL